MQARLPTFPVEYKIQVISNLCLSNILDGNCTHSSEGSSVQLSHTSRLLANYSLVKTKLVISCNRNVKVKPGLSPPHLLRPQDDGSSGGDGFGGPCL